MTSEKRTIGRVVFEELPKRSRRECWLCDYTKAVVVARMADKSEVRAILLEDLGGNPEDYSGLEVGNPDDYLGEFCEDCKKELEQKGYVEFFEDNELPILGRW